MNQKKRERVALEVEELGEGERFLPLVWDSKDMKVLLVMVACVVLAEQNMLPLVIAMSTHSNMVSPLALMLFRTSGDSIVAVEFVGYTQLGGNHNQECMLGTQKVDK